VDRSADRRHGWRARAFSISRSMITSPPSRRIPSPHCGGRVGASTWCGRQCHGAEKIRLLRDLSFTDRAHHGLRCHWSLMMVIALHAANTRHRYAIFKGNQAPVACAWNCGGPCATSRSAADGDGHPDQRLNPDGCATGIFRSERQAENCSPTTLRSLLLRAFTALPPQKVSSIVFDAHTPRTNLIVPKGICGLARDPDTVRKQNSPNSRPLFGIKQHYSKVCLRIYISRCRSTQQVGLGMRWLPII